MPEIKFKHLVSCTSEDKVYKAENLLKPELYRKWKCASPGEKSASAILQLEKATEIHSIDIGNESSAFVEVLVGKSADATNNFQVLLAASSFMSPLESRNDTKNNRVRMFGPEKLAQNLKKEKWDCIKIVCTQPFNKNIQYGLSFVKLHSPPDPAQQSTDQSQLKESSLKLGAFKLKDEDDDDGNILSVGSLFQKRNERSNSLPLSGAAAIRQASSLAAAELVTADNSASQICTKSLTETSSVKRKYTVDPTDSSSSKNDKQFKTVHVDRSKVEFKKLHDETPEKDKSQPSKILQTTKKSVDKVQPPKVKPFNRIMEKVVFVLSGFQNPFRSDLRDKALEMGAQYKGDWDNSCTHLICAFLKTPKYNQVLKEKGRIVTKEWIIDCHKKKKLLPWRKYMLGKYSKDTTTEEEDSEEEEIQIEAKKETKVQEALLNDCVEAKTAKAEKESENKEISGNHKTNGTLGKSVPEKDSVICSSEEEDYQADTDVDCSSGCDTEEEIRKVVEQQNKRANHNKDPETPKRSKVKKTLFEESSSNDEDDDDIMIKPDTKDLPLPELPRCFKGKHFFLYGNFTSEEMHNLNRYIIGFSGSIEQYMGENVKFVITKKRWDKNFDEALSENDNLIFVRPQWIFKCGQDCRFVPYQPYIVVPDS